MKKLLLSILLGGAISGASAQEKSITAWYNYGYEISYNMAQDVDYYLTHVFPDSTVQVEYSSGLGSVWMHGLGQVFDPTSFVWSVDLDQVGEFDAYVLDSISIPYRYFRFQDAAPDTLKIQLIKEPAYNNLYEDPWASDPTYGGRSYARISYDSTLLRSDSTAMEFIELLDYNDTASTKKSIDIAINELIPGGQTVAVTVTYVPGNPYNIGDTLDAEFNTVGGVTNKINDFIMNYYVDNDQNHETGVYNHGIIATADGRYDIDTYNWNKQYWPGIASGGGFYHADINFLISTFNGIETQDKASQVVIYPNPVTNEGTVSINIQQPFENGSIQITDINGKLMETIQLRNTNIGTQVVSFSTLDFSSGLYFVNLNLDQVTTTSKLIVQK